RVRQLDGGGHGANHRALLPHPPIRVDHMMAGEWHSRSPPHPPVRWYSRFGVLYRYGMRFDFLPSLKRGDSNRRRLGFLLHSRSPAREDSRGGLTPAPQAFYLSASPAARMFLAALTSRSWVAPQGQVHCRTFSGMASCRAPHALHSLLLGDQRSTAITSRPYQAALYSSI